MDIVDSSTRSRMMSGIKGTNTKPERIIRSNLFRLGFRFRLHTSYLPGKPDIVFPKYKAVIMINGCFWHCHHCHLFKWPNTRKEFWLNKIKKNVENDKKVLNQLEVLGWHYLVIWECALKGKNKIPLDGLISKIETWLKNEKKHNSTITGKIL